MSDFDFRKHLIECMSSTDFFALATVDEKGVWNNPVYFAWDVNFNLYFISKPNSRHMQNISKNSRVSVAIYKTAQKGDVIGIQLEGEAKILINQDEKEQANKVYYGRVGSSEQNEPFVDDPDWLFVKITPEKIYYFDSKAFGEDRQEVPLFSK